MKKNLLIVDDEVYLLEALIERLEARGFNVYSATSGNKAFDVFINNKIDAIISDVRMPDGDGIDLVKRVIAVNRNIPIISFITGHTDISLRDAYKIGVSAIFSKPFDFEQILDHINNLMLPFDEKWKEESPSSDSILEVCETYISMNYKKNNGLFDIGRGGISIVTDKNLPPIQDFVSFAFNFKDLSVENFNGIGRVLWKELCDKEGQSCGIEFFNIGDKLKKEIGRFIEKNNPIAYLPDLRAR